MIWTTTPWTLPANRAVSYSRRIGYGLYRVTAAPDRNWASVGATYLLADALAEGVFKAAKADDANLPMTGIQTDWLALAGVALLATGLAVKPAVRRRRRTGPHRGRPVLRPVVMTSSPLQARWALR